MSRKVKYPNAAFTAAMAVYGIVCARDVTVYRFLDRVDLVAHEAGHLFFSWFGGFLQVLGGTIGQLFVPIALTAYFFLRRERFSAAVTLFWTGQSLFNISVYVKDARAMVLPLVAVGAADADHDWNFLLSRAGLLHLDQAIGALAYLLGLAVIAAAVAAAGWYSLEPDDVGQQGHR